MIMQDLWCFGHQGVEGDWQLCWVSSPFLWPTSYGISPNQGRASLAYCQAARTRVGLLLHAHDRPTTGVWGGGGRCWAWDSPARSTWRGGRLGIPCTALGALLRPKRTPRPQPQAGSWCMIIPVKQNHVAEPDPGGSCFQASIGPLKNRNFGATPTHAAENRFGWSISEEMSASRPMRAQRASVPRSA